MKFILFFYFRELSFPEDSLNVDLNAFMKMLMHKKVNRRVCSFSKLKLLSLLSDFNWDDLINFKLKPPYNPEIMDYNKQIPKFSKNFENYINVKIQIFLQKNFLYFLNFFLFFKF